MKHLLLNMLMLVSVCCTSTGAFAQQERHEFPKFNNKTFTAEQQPFADLSQKIWDLMAQKNADELKTLFHPNCEFVHMGGYWGTD